MKENTFKVRARLIEQLGEQLIKNESIALIELIKNAYDADASTVRHKNALNSFNLTSGLKFGEYYTFINIGMNQLILGLTNLIK